MWIKGVFYKMVTDYSSGIQGAAEINTRILLIKKYKAFGFHAKEVSEILAADHNITVSYQTIQNDFTEINSGKYAESYLDLLLDVNYPEMFETALQEISKDLEILAELRDTTINESIKAKVTMGRIKLHMGLLDTMHKGAVIREMKKLSTKAKILVREILQQDSMIKKRGNILSLTNTSDDMKKKIVEFDEDLSMIEAGLEPETAKNEME